MSEQKQDLGTPVGRGEATVDLRGKWAICSRHRLGKIEGRKTLAWGESWVGTGIDGTAWASRHPTVLPDADQSAIAAILSPPANSTMRESLRNRARSLASDATDYAFEHQDCNVVMAAWLAKLANVIEQMLEATDDASRGSTTPEASPNE